ncbi:MAG TPA: sulfatase-like hydrolase/transferase [Opitutaceae bacterium]|nr:sulfatase-like hydrolase/transferase [Opitutaceae bacterium]
MTRRLVLTLLLVALGSSVTAVAAPAGRPNVLIAIADDWSFPHATAYGTGWVRTPAFDRVAREGVLFLNAYTPVAKCSASRASLLTGRNPWQLGAGFTHWSYFPPEVPTVTETLAAAGHRVGFTGKGWAPGVARHADGSPRALLGTAFQKRKAPPPTTGISGNDYAANFVDFLDAAPAGAPWLFWYGGTEPHRAYEAGSGMAKGGKTADDIRRIGPTLRRRDPICSTTPSKWSISTPTSAACWRNWSAADCWTTPLSSSPPTMACPSPGRRGSATTSPFTSPSPSAGPARSRTPAAVWTTT